MHNLYQPGMIIQARGRLWRLESVTEKTLTGSSLDAPDQKPHSFFLPLEGESIKLAAMDFPPEQAGDPVLHELFLRANRMTMMHSSAPLASLQRSRVIPTNYQLVPVMMALDMPSVRLLIADDVGLGKTVEAGLITVELLARKQAKRILVLTPANLREQWQDAFGHFFHLDFELLSTPTVKKLGKRLPPGANPWAHFDQVICSIDYGKQDSVKNLILQQRWDLVIIDEAHGAALPLVTAQASAKKERYDFAKALSLQTEHLLLITATPHNGYSSSFASLLRMLDERQIQGRIRSSLNLVEGELAEPLIRRKQATRHVVQRRREDVASWFETEGKRSPFPRRDAQEVFIEPSPTELEVYRAFQAYQRFVLGRSDGSTVPVLAKWMIMHFLRRATSSPRALRNSLRNRIERLEQNLAQDLVLADASALETELKSSVLDAGATELFSEAESDSRLDRLSLFERSLIQAELGFLREIAAAVSKWRPAQTSKLKALKDLLLNPMQLGAYGRTIVFTRYVDTLTFLAEELGKETGLEVFTVEGSLSEKARLERIEAFAQAERAVLIATDAISEGLNLQFAANQLVHYELPWNPNRIEQRNGRIDRFRQPEKEVRIRTLINERSFDLVVFNKLIAKAKSIREAYGFLPGYFGDDNYVENMIAELIDEGLTQQKYGQIGLFDAPKAEGLSAEEEKLMNKMQAESFYGQANFNLPDVEARLQESQALIGSPREIERLVIASFRHFNWQVTEAGAHSYAVKRAGARPISGIADDLGFITFDADTAVMNSQLEHLDIAHPVVGKLLKLIRQEAYTGLKNARTAVFCRKLPAGIPAHALYHIRARFHVGDGDGLIESLIPLAINLFSKEAADDELSRQLLSADNQPLTLPALQVSKLLKTATELEDLNHLIDYRVGQEAEKLIRERQTLKARLKEAYPSQSDWLGHIELIRRATHDVLTLSLIVPARAN